MIVITSVIVTITVSRWFNYYHTAGWYDDRTMIVMVIIRATMIITMTTDVNNRNGFTMIRLMKAS